ncbi:MAG: DUF2442 domain-containing protein [Lachnospiraceae bacterium]|nr:DUF2442 domain-containing protein [Lachnospiraceae bacterium]
MYISDGIVYGNKGEADIKIVAVKPLEDMMMIVKFSSGETRLFDAKVLQGKVFEPLKLSEVFFHPVIEHGVITWNNGNIDCAPEYIYEHSYEHSMVSMEDINMITMKFATKMKNLFGESFNSAILYGSYARGDYCEGSDIDIMILVSLTEQEIKEKLNLVCDCALEYLMKYSVDISPIVKNVEHFNKWVDTLPFYRNVREDGIVLVSQ